MSNSITHNATKSTSGSATEHQIAPATAAGSAPGGDVASETKILVDVPRIPVQAARIVAAFRTWAARDEARMAWGPDPCHRYYLRSNLLPTCDKVATELRRSVDTGSLISNT